LIIIFTSSSRQSDTQKIKGILPTGTLSSEIISFFGSGTIRFVDAYPAMGEKRYRSQNLVEKLPFELVLERTYLVAGVAANVTTRVDFVVRPEFGIAGRVTDRSGNFLPGIVVEILDSQGNVIKSASTDQFGLYRILRMSNNSVISP
jgi:hypothetical protein